MLHILQYPYPTLRHKSSPLKKVDAQLREWVAQMFALMYEHKGIGLAANQVDLPYRLFVMNLSGDPAEKDQEQVFINPIISKKSGSGEAEEGCLSLPGLHAVVRRPERVRIEAYNLRGEEVVQDLDGLAARCVQHETDHLDGVLFIDRLAPTVAAQVREAIEDFEDEFANRIQRGELTSFDDFPRRMELLERERC